MLLNVAIFYYDTGRYIPVLVRHCDSADPNAQMYRSQLNCQNRMLTSTVLVILVALVALVATRRHRYVAAWSTVVGQVSYGWMEFLLFRLSLEG